MYWGTKPQMIALERESLDFFLDYKKMKIDSLTNLIPSQSYSFRVLENHHGWNVSRAVALGDINFDGTLFVSRFLWVLCLQLIIYL